MENTDITEAECKRYLEWISQNYSIWNKITLYQEMDENSLYDILQVLHDNNLHILYFIVLDTYRVFLGTDDLVREAFINYLVHNNTTEIVCDIEKQILNLLKDI